MPFFVVPGTGGGGGGVNSVSGTAVNNADPSNPVVTATTPIRVSAGSFSGNDYTNASLIGKVAQTDFDVIAGGFLSTPSDYTFVSGTGTITIPSGPNDILIIKYR